MEQFKAKHGIIREVVLFKHETRTIEQFLAVKSITERKDFDFLSSPRGVFGRNGWKGKPCSFAIYWYDKNGELHGNWITPKGKIVE